MEFEITTDSGVFKLEFTRQYQFTRTSIPFFSTDDSNQIIGINTLVKKEIKSSNLEKLDFKDFKKNKINEFLNQLTNLIDQIVPNDDTVKSSIIAQINGVLNNSKKPSLGNLKKLVRNLIKYFELIVNGLSNITNQDLIKSYCENYVKLLILQKQLGLKKRNRIVATVVSMLLAICIALSQAYNAIVNFFAKKGANSIIGGVQSVISDIFPANLQAEQTVVPTVAQTVKPTARPTAVPTVAQTARPTARPTATQTARPTSVPTATQPPKYSLNSSMFMNWKNANLNKFEFLRGFAVQYGCDYDALITGYTYVEHAHEISGASSSQITNYVGNARTLISFVIYNQQYDLLSLQQNTFHVFQQCLDGNQAQGITFVADAYSENIPVLDMLAIGELEGYMLFDESLNSFNLNTYYNVINRYKNDMQNGSYYIEGSTKIKVLKNGLMNI